MYVTLTTIEFHRHDRNQFIKFGIKQLKGDNLVILHELKDLEEGPPVFRKRALVSIRWQRFWLRIKVFIKTSAGIFHMLSNNWSWRLIHLELSLLIAVITDANKFVE